MHTFENQPSNLVGSILGRKSSGEGPGKRLWWFCLTSRCFFQSCPHACLIQVDKVNVTMGYPVKNAPVYFFSGSGAEMQPIHSKWKRAKLLFYHTRRQKSVELHLFKSENLGFTEELWTKCSFWTRIHVSQKKLHKGGAMFNWSSKSWRTTHYSPTWLILMKLSWAIEANLAAILPV